ISGQIQSVHTTALQNHESLGTNVSSLLQRLGAAEITLAEEQGKRELMKRQMEDRLEQVSSSRTPVKMGDEALREGAADISSPRSREAARMAVQLEVQEKELKRLAKDFQSQAKSLDRISEQQRRLAQEQATDVSRNESSRLEERKGTEKSEKRLKARLEELEARLEMMQSGSPKAISRLESHRFDRLPEASLADVARTLEEQRAVLAEHDARQQNTQKLFSQLEKSAQDVQPLLQKKLADHDARLEQQASELIQARDQAVQLGRQNTELRTQLEAQKDVVEIRCLEKLEVQGKRMEEVANRLQQLEDTSRSTLHQVKQVPDLEKRTDRL
ncbi:LAMB1, partial [Symbiodinium pilosum]